MCNKISKICNVRPSVHRLRSKLVRQSVICVWTQARGDCNFAATRRVILYFTATGNSLYVARQLAGETGELLSIPQLVKAGRYEVEADEIGIVYPVYGHMPPNMVREFIRKARLKAGYRFAVLTYGNRKCNSAEIWDEVPRKAGCPFDYITTMIMVDNWLPNFDMNEQMKIDKHIPESLERISFACIHNCPQKAIVFRQMKEVNPDARYRNEHVSLWSIKESNRQ